MKCENCLLRFDAEREVTGLASWRLLNNIYKFKLLLTGGILRFHWIIQTVNVLWLLTFSLITKPRINTFGWESPKFLNVKERLMYNGRAKSFLTGRTVL